MAKYTIEAPEGPSPTPGAASAGKYMIEPPAPSAADDKPESPYGRALSDARKQRKGDEVASTAAHGITLGFSTDIDAALAALGQGAANLSRDIKGEKKPYGMADAAAASRQADKEARARFKGIMPHLAGATEFTSGLFTPAPELSTLGKVSPLLRAGAQGGLLGFLGGVGNADGGLKQKAKAGAVGATVGAPLAAGIHGLTNPADFIKGTASALGEAVSRVKDFVDAEPGRVTPQQAAAGKKQGEKFVANMVGDNLIGLESNKAEKLGKPVTAGEALGRKGVKQLKIVNRRSGSASDVLDPRMAQRNRETATRILHDIHDVTKIDPHTVRGNMERTATAMRKKAGPLYDKWHAHEEVDSPELAKILETNSGKAALTEAAKIASDEHADAYKLGLVPEPAEPGIPRGHVVFEHNGRRYVVKKGREAADTQHALGGKEPTQDGDALWEHYDEEMENLKNANRPKVLTARGWDYMKRGMDKVLAGYRDKITHKLDLHDPGVIQLLRLRQELNEGLTNPKTPWGKDAARAFEAGGDPIRMEESFEDGKKLISNNVTMADFDKRWGRMSAPDKEALKGGIASAIKDAAGQGRLRLKELLTPDAEAKFKKVFGEKEGAELMDRLRIEQDMFETAYRVHSKGGSDTYENFEAASDQREAMRNVEAGLKGFRAASHGDVWSAMFHFLRAPFVGTWRASQQPIDQVARDRVGQLLAMKPSELAKFLREEGAKPEDISQFQQVLEQIGKGGDFVAPRAAGQLGAAVGRGSNEDGDE